MRKKTTITHLTSAHDRYDTRIFVKMCTSSANQGFKISLIVADGKGDSVKNEISIFDVAQKKRRSRLSRMIITTTKIFKKAKELNTDIYHIHDPELIQVGLKLKRAGKKVIFDAHEDLEKQILHKPYLNKIIAPILSRFIKLYMLWAMPQFDAVITATPYIQDKFFKINQNTININNFPLIQEFPPGQDWSLKKNEVAYVGGITETRGISEILEALCLTPGTRLNLAGNFSEKVFEKKIKNSTGWRNVNELGFLDRTQVSGVLKNSKIGLVTLHPTANYIDALPVKMFEYMAAGIPVIASHFPLWSDIVETHHCGICVDPLKPKSIAKAIHYLMTNQKEAEAMGKRGRQMVKEQYNWSIEEKKLLRLYKDLSE